MDYDLTELRRANLACPANVRPSTWNVTDWVGLDLQPYSQGDDDMSHDIKTVSPLDAQASKRLTSDVKPRYLATPDAAIHLGLSARTLEKHRCYGTGPIFRKLGGKVVYAIDDLDAWAAIGTRQSTSDPGAGTVHPAKQVDKRKLKASRR
jgi:hypothetical protein